MHTCIRARTHTKCRYICKHIHTHTPPLQTHSPSPIQMFSSPLWIDGWNFDGKNNKIVHSSCIYYLALHNTEGLFSGMCSQPFSVGPKNRDRERGRKTRGENPQNEARASVVAASLSRLTLLTCEGGKKGSGLTRPASWAAGNRIL